MKILSFKSISIGTLFFICVDIFVSLPTVQAEEPSLSPSSPAPTWAEKWKRITKVFVGTSTTVYKHNEAYVVDDIP